MNTTKKLFLPYLMILITATALGKSHRINVDLDTSEGVQDMNAQVELIPGAEHFSIRNDTFSHRMHRETDALIKDTSSSSLVIFNGKDLDNWTGDARYWRVENGTLIGEVKPGQELQHNSFLVWKGTMPKDFELWVDFRISPEGNSGINYRSQRVEGIDHALRGYQADIDGADQFTGQVYEERGRTTLAYRWESSRILPFADTARFTNYTRNNNWLNRKVESPLKGPDQDRSRTQTGQWSRYHIVVKGNHIKHFVNDVLVSEVVDEDIKNSTTSGQFGVQVHVGPPMKVEFRNFVVKEL